MDKKNDNKMTIRIDISDSLANSIRRYVNEIQVLAVNEVEIIKNDSALYDETIAHRIGLIPLKNEKVFDEKRGGYLKLSVNKQGIVYSKDLKGSLSVVYENMPITNLEKDQEIELIAEVNYGKGIEHAKYIPGFMYYKNLKEIKSGSKGQEINDILSHCVNYCGEENGTAKNYLDHHWIYFAPYCSCSRSFIFWCYCSNCSRHCCSLCITFFTATTSNCF